MGNELSLRRVVKLMIIERPFQGASRTSAPSAYERTEKRKDWGKEAETVAISSFHCPNACVIMSFTMQ
jgi:hypothetical protein